MADVMPDESFQVWTADQITLIREDLKSIREVTDMLAKALQNPMLASLAGPMLSSGGKMPWEE